MRLFDPRDLHVGGSGSSDTDAVRPTGETGARCPTIHEVMAAARRLIAAREFLGLERGDDDQGSHREIRDLLRDYDATPRPLPDFPAGAAGPWRSSPHFDYHLRDANNVYVGGVSYSVDRERCIEIRDFILSRVNALARPAAAGVTLTDAEREACIDVGVKAMFKEVDDDADETYIVALDSPMEGLRVALAHAESLLSSRATGAQVEIPTWTDDDFCKSLCEHMGSSSLEGYEPMRRQGMRHGFAAGIKWAREQYARRHATIRPGGGE